MISTFVQQLPTVLIEKITYDLNYLYARSCNQELDDVLDSALNSRLCDLENTLEINSYVQHLLFWKEIEREFGAFEVGDVLWDLDGSIYLIRRLDTSNKDSITLDYAKELYIKGELSAIAIDDAVMSLKW